MHGNRGRQANDGGNRLYRAQQGCKHSSRGADGVKIEALFEQQEGEGEEIGVQPGQSPAQPQPGDRADGDPHQRDDQDHLGVMGADGPIGIAERLEKTHLLALKRDEPRQDHVDQKGRDEQEDRRDHHRHGAQLRQLGVEKGIGRLVLALIGLSAAIRFEQAIDSVAHNPQIGIACGGERQIIETRLEACKRSQHVFRHEQDAVAAAVGHHVAGTDGIDVLRRQHGAGDLERHHLPADDDSEAVAGFKAMGLGKGLGNCNLIGTICLRQAAGTDVKPVDRRFANRGDGNGKAGGGLPHTLDVENHRLHHTQCHGRHARNGRQPRFKP